MLAGMRSVTKAGLWSFVSVLLVVFRLNSIFSFVHLVILFNMHSQFVQLETDSKKSGQDQKLTASKKSTIFE